MTQVNVWLAPIYRSYYLSELFHILVTNIVSTKIFLKEYYNDFRPLSFSTLWFSCLGMS